jgi:hypothetical protein
VRVRCLLPGLLGRRAWVAAGRKPRYLWNRTLSSPAARRIPAIKSPNEVCQESAYSGLVDRDHFAGGEPTVSFPSKLSAEFSERTDFQLVSLW